MGKKMLRHAIIGIGFGSFSYLLVLLFKVQTTMPTTSNIISILVMSVGIGWLSLLFDGDRLPWLAAVGLHWVGTFLLVVVMMSFNHWLRHPSFWVVFVALYIICWVVVRVQHYLQVERINTAIAKRRQKRADQ